MKSKIDYTLYLVTDAQKNDSEQFYDKIEQSICNGVSIVQLREKNIDTGSFYYKALRVKQITKKYNIPFIINDRIDIMLAVDADGVHLGQSDMPANVARGIIGKDKILGLSVSNLMEAKKACEDSADYLGVGAMFPTSTKPDANLTTIEELRKIKMNINIPIVVIGGINLQTISKFNKNVDGFAVVSAIMNAPNAAEASRQLRGKIKILKTW